MSIDPGTDAASDPLERLVVIDRLEVGPPRIEPRRLTTPYTVHAGGETHSTELAYRWEDEVLDPADPADGNLAAMIGAQVALNYGLFCREIVFHGPFDEADRRFLRAMAANTAREIYVDKLLMPNEFLVGMEDLPVVRRESYLQAELLFPEAPARLLSSWTAAEDGPVAVLASGGKDSLLSYGLLDEAGLVTHSVFVNESGRHWHTAINGYRHLRETRPETTTRVWTSSDRLFSWMLKRLPFVRPDFARLRSDHYPIRLWTVAVFLFGALPVLKRRGIARLVIGDEYDTTYRTRYRGITHYDGLYDQSRHFDEALTRYYRRKGSSLQQFSLLRPLSELLIQKVLVERYPDLQRHQMSCHATHIDEQDRARPCGRCEKCRRIVAMLTALDADPTACGYTPEQVAGALADLPQRGVSQERVALEHLAWMLAQRGLLPEGVMGSVKGRARQEVVSLRFDERASPPDLVPPDLRRRILPLLLRHAEGAVRRNGPVWEPFDPLAAVEPANTGAEASPAPEPPASAAKPPRVKLGELTWLEAKRRLAEIDTALLPVGAVEQHGPHLPLDTDAWDAEHLCCRVAEACTDPKPLVLPLIPYGVSYHHDSFPGTLSVGPSVLADFVYHVGLAAARHGIVKLIIVNGHGGNAPTLQLAAQKINRDARIFTCVDSGETSDHDIARLTETPNDVHAGEVETSTALATRPELVDMSRARPAVPAFSSQYLDFTSKHSVPWYEHTAEISPTGVLGDPTRATAEKGQRIWELMVRHLVRLVESLKGMSLEEIYEWRH